MLKTTSADEPSVAAVDPAIPSAATSRTFAALSQRVFGSTTVGYVVSFAFAIAVWELVKAAFSIKDYILPTPLSVLGQLTKYHSALFDNSVTTVREILVGFGLAVGAGVILGIGITFSKILKSLLYPLFVASNAIPKVAIAPLLVIWFGFSPVTNAIVAFSVAVFPVVINVSAGLQRIDPAMVSLGRVMGGNQIRTFTMIRLPIALPTFFAGFKLAMANATVGAVVGEFVASSSGLGYLAQQASGKLNTEFAFATLLVLAVIGIVLFSIVEVIERVVVRY